MNEDFATKLHDALDRMERETIAAFFGRMVTIRALKAELATRTQEPKGDIK